MVLYESFDKILIFLINNFSLNSNILVSLESIIILQKYLFSHTLLCHSSWLVVLKE